MRAHKRMINNFEKPANIPHQGRLLKQGPQNLKKPWSFSPWPTADLWNSPHSLAAVELCVLDTHSCCTHPACDAISPVETGARGGEATFTTAVPTEAVGRHRAPLGPVRANFHVYYSCWPTADWFRMFWAVCRSIVSSLQQPSFATWGK